jgi:hypothetical protein
LFPQGTQPPSPSNEVGGLVQRLSTDGGRTWSDPKTIYSGDIDFYTTVLDAETMTLWLMLQEGSAVRVGCSCSTPAAGRQAQSLCLNLSFHVSLFPRTGNNQPRHPTPPQVFTSTTNGTSWQGPLPLHVNVPAPFSSSIKPAVGHGVQIEDRLCGAAGCKHAGRLIMPFVCMNSSSAATPTVRGDSGACEACHACLLLSDDKGTSWHFGGIGQAGSRESQAVQVPSTSSDAALYVTERNFGATPGHRMYARSVDSGDSLADFGIDTTIVSPITAHWTGIVAAVLRRTYPQGGDNGEVVLATASAVTERANLTMRASTDNGKTWGEPRTFWPGLGGYVDLVRVGDGGVGAIFENGEQTFADRISYSLFPAGWFESHTLLQ